MPWRRILALLLWAALLPAGPVRAEEDDAASLLESDDWQKRVEGLRRLEDRGGDERAVEAALPLLHDEDWEVQIHAAETLGKLGTKGARDALLRHAVLGEIAWVREAAVRALGEGDAAKAAERLLAQARRRKEDRERARALEGVGALAPASLLPHLRAWIRYKDLEVAAAAVRAVGRIAARDPAAHETALALLAHPLKRRDERKHFFAYAAAVEALGHVDLPLARVALVRELLLQPDEDPYVPRRIARILATQDPVTVRGVVDDLLPEIEDDADKRRVARLAAEARIRPLAPLIAALRATTKDERLDAEATRAHGLLGDEKDVPALRQGLEQSGSARVRVEVVTALARLLDPPAFRELRGVVSADANAEVRRQFVVEVHDQGDPAGIPALASFVRDEDWQVASAAIAAIGTLGVASELPLLEPLARHRDWKIRATAYEAMGRLRAAKAIPRLTYGLEDRDPVVRGVCLANLQILSRERLEGDPKTWQAWWRKHGEDLVLRKRSRMTPEEREREEAERAKARYAHERYALERRRGVEILQKARILVVTGAWDHVEVVLDHLDIPHTAMRAQQLKTAGLNPNQVVLVNCEGNVDKDAQERLRWFVNVGGYLMTTDWALTKTVEPCFPGYMKQYSGATTGNDVVVVEASRPDHPFVAGIFENVPALMWWLEVRAFPITITYRERCEVLVDSAEMRQRYGSSPMATVFRWGLGKVQHSVSHFYLQEEGMQKATKPRDRMIFAADNLGLTLEQIRTIREAGGFDGQLNEATMREIAPDYSMFRLIVNVVKEKSDWVENL